PWPKINRTAKRRLTTTGRTGRLLNGASWRLLMGFLHAPKIFHVVAPPALDGLVGQNQDEGGAGEADDDRGQDQGLGERVGVGQPPAGRGDPPPHNGRPASLHATGNEEHQVGGMGDEHRPQDDPEHLPLEEQVDAGTHQQPDDQRGQEFHGSPPSPSGRLPTRTSPAPGAAGASRPAPASSSSSSPPRSPEMLRMTDWVVPTTTRKTPRSKSWAVVSSTSTPPRRTVPK